MLKTCSSLWGSLRAFSFLLLAAVKHSHTSGHIHVHKGPEIRATLPYLSIKRFLTLNHPLSQQSRTFTQTMKEYGNVDVFVSKILDNYQKSHMSSFLLLAAELLQDPYLFSKV